MVEQRRHSCKECHSLVMVGQSWVGWVVAVPCIELPAVSELIPGCSCWCCILPEGWGCPSHKLEPHQLSVECTLLLKQEGCASICHLNRTTGSVVAPRLGTQPGWP